MMVRIIRARPFAWLLDELFPAEPPLLAEGAWFDGRRAALSQVVEMFSPSKPANDTLTTIPRASRPSIGWTDIPAGWSTPSHTITD